MMVRILTSLFITVLLIMTFGCKRDIDLLEPAQNPTFGEVYLDAFVAGLDYSAFANSKYDAFSIDKKEYFKGTSSIKITVPGENDPSGWFAGGAFFSKFPRDLSDYNALTFWGKADKTALAEVGFGNDNAGNEIYSVMQKNVLFGTSWKKYIIPIPLADKLTAERGMLQYAAGADENGYGGNIWMDEIKYEKLGTIAYPRPLISSTNIEGEVGEMINSGVTGVTFNVDGVDQTVNAAPAYFTLISSDESIAKATEDGKISALAVGTAEITVKLGSVEAEDKITVNVIPASPKPAAPAPVPTANADSVISLFSNAYTNVLVDTWNPFWEFSTAEVKDIQIDGDDVKRYTNLNFVGIEFTSQTIDATNMTHFHIDFWTPDPAASAEFEVKLVDFGADNAFGGDNDSEAGIKVTSPTLVSETWIGVDIPLSGLAGKANVAQLILVGNDNLNTVYIDNAYFYIGSGNGGPVNGPTEPAPTPNRDAADVFSIYSDAYTDLANSNFNPDWGQSTVQSFEVIAGNNTIKYDMLNYQGTNLGSADGGVPQDVSGYDYLHVDFWTPNATALNFFILDQADGEVAYPLTIATEQWVSVDIPLSHFSGGGENLADIHQFKVDGGDGASTVVWFDNWYFYKDGGSSGDMEPTTAAPTPTKDAADVFSIFSDAYTDLENTNFNPGWGQSTVQTFEVIAGDNTIKYDVLNYQGTNLGSADGGVPQDVSGYDYLHVDFWTPNATALNFFIIDQSEGEVSYPLPITTGEWVSVDIPLSHFSGGGENLADIHQFKVDGGDGSSTVVWFDNWYFYKESGSAESDASLSDLQVDGTTISGFSPNITSYSVQLQQGTTVVPTVTVTENNANASSVITPATSLPGTTTIVVTAQDGTTQKTYTVAFTVKSDDAWTISDVIDFEASGYGSGWTWNVFENDANPALEFVANPDASGANTSSTVAKFTALQAGQPWAGCETAHGELGITFDLSASNAFIKIMVYKTVISDVGIKLANPAGGAQPEIKVANTKINEWEELTFDFSDRIGNGLDGSTNIDQIIVFPDFDLDGRAQDNVIYFDNIRFSSN